MSGGPSRRRGWRPTAHGQRLRRRARARHPLAPSPGAPIWSIACTPRSAGSAAPPSSHSDRPPRRRARPETRGSAKGARRPPGTLSCGCRARPDRAGGRRPHDGHRALVAEAAGTPSTLWASQWWSSAVHLGGRPPVLAAVRRRRRPAQARRYWRSARPSPARSSSASRSSSRRTSSSPCPSTYRRERACPRAHRPRADRAQLSLSVEVDGRWPWQGAPEESRGAADRG